MVQLLNHAQKVFEVGPAGTGRMALCTWGAGKAGRLSHRTIAARLGDAVTPETSISDAANELVKIVEAAFAAAASPRPPGVLGYFLGGASKDHEPGCIQLVFNGGKVTSRDTFGVGDARFQGAPQMFHRAYRGFDPDLPGALHDALARKLDGKVPAADLRKLYIEAFHEAASGLTAGGHNDMPIREAIDFCHMYLQLTIKGFKFRFGPPVVGGPVELAFVSSDRQFRWVRHKAFDSAIAEQEGGSE